jgi:UDP-N-acetylglucosamine 2-epimerase (non-hydrolysing)
MTKIAFVLGTRPEIIKLYSSIKYCEDSKTDYFVVNTDQHYDKNMRDVFFEELGLPTPKYNLGVGSGSHAQMLAAMLVPLEEVFLKEKPTVVVVQGDTNTVLAGCLVATKMGIKVAHVEAGLRSYDRTMPEEYNRLITDHTSDYLFAPTVKQRDILLGEGISRDSIIVTGNTIVDAVLSISKNEIVLGQGGKFMLLTCHRPSNTDNAGNLDAILSAVQSICEEEGMICIFPVHPRLKSKIQYVESFSRIKVVEPLGYSVLLSHIKESEVIMTDSGGIQEEACILEKKCVILRTNTERPETVEVGGAILLDEVTKKDIIAKYELMRDKVVDWKNPFGDGKSAERIIKTLTEEN